MSSLGDFIQRHKGDPVVATVGVLIVLVVTFSFFSDRFLTWSNFQNVARSTSAVVIVGSAVTLVMIARGLDLSVGAVLAASTVTAALVASSGSSLGVAYLSALAVGLAFGMLNAFLVVGLHVGPIIATLGTLNIARGVAFLITPSAIIVGLPENWAAVGTGSAFGIPHPVSIAIVVALAFAVLLNRTVFGRHVYAIGGNEQAARIAGVNVPFVLATVYTLSGLATGVAAIVLSSRLGSGDPNIGVGFEFDVIVAVILGGTSLSGGEGRISGTVLGALIVGFLSNGLNLAGVDPFWQFVAKGVALIVAVVLDRMARSGRRAIASRGQSASSPATPANQGVET